MQATTELTAENFIAIAGLIVTIIGFVFIYGQIHEMRKQREQNQVVVKITNAYMKPETLDPQTFFYSE